MVVGDLVVSAGQRMNAPVDQLHEAVDAVVMGFRLADEAANHAQDIAHAVVELRDQQFLALIGLLALHGRFVCHAQHDLDQRRTQRLGNAQLRRGEGPAVAFDQFLPFGEAFPRRQARSVGAVFDRLVRVAAPAHRAEDLLPE